jgi:hypothetical protein
MSIKNTKIFYPHIVKEYGSVAQFVSENNYTAYYNEMRAGIAAFGIDLDDETQYQEALSADMFETIATIAFADEASALNYASNAPEVNVSVLPIFSEESDEHLF